MDAVLVTLYVELVALVRSLHVSLNSFHLTACGGCGMPSFQQPCPMCGYYPYGNDPEERRRCQSQGVTEENWLRAVERHGGILAWYLDGHCRNTVAWTSPEPLWRRWRSEMEALMKLSRTMPLPDPRDILKAVREVDRNKDFEKGMELYRQTTERAKQLCAERGEDWNDYARHHGYGKKEATYTAPTVDELLEAERGIDEQEP